MRRRVTIRDIARKAGVSSAAVSYALNNRPGVSPQTRAKVLAIAQELDWYATSPALALSGRGTGTIGVVLARSSDVFSWESFFGGVIAGLEERLDAVDGAVLLRLTQPGDDLRVLERWAKQRRVDGFLLFDELVQDARLPLLADLEVPAVLVGAGPRPPDDPAPAMPRLVSLDDAGAELVVTAAAEAGYRAIHHVGGPLRLRHEGSRRTVLEAACRRRGLAYTHEEGDYGFPYGVAAGERLRGVSAGTVAVFGNDVMAVAAATTLPMPSGRRGAPGLLAWDDSHLCRFSRPAMSALHRDAGQLGAEGVGMLLEAIRGDIPADRTLQQGDLRLRDSVPVCAPAGDLS